MCDGKKCTTCEHRLTCTGCPDKVVFADAAVFDKISKTIQSVRDGVYEYLGKEIGVKPDFKIFKVYRSPETVKNLSALMNGIPLTDGHVAMDKEPDEVITNINGTELEDFIDEDLGSTVIIKHKIDNCDSVIELNQDGKNELSLGFKANLIEHDEYDFEQTEFEPHHLAVLERGRCGTACRFIDQKPDNKETPMKKLFSLMKTFTDAEGEMTLQQLMEMVSALPEAIRTVPMDEIQKLAPALKEIIDVAQAAGVEVVEPAEEEVADGEATEEVEATDMDGSEKEMEGMDMTALGDLIAAERGEVTMEQIAESAGRDVDTIENIIAGNIKTPPREVLEGIASAINVSVDRLIDALPDEKEEEVQAEDEEPSDEEKLAMADGVLLFTDAQAQERISAAVIAHSEAVEHARQFVDEAFDFTGKSTEQIHKDVVESVTGETFEDSKEAAIAFRLLKPGSMLYKEFGDASFEKQFDNLKDKEI
jgi:hypothetical protein